MAGPACSNFDYMHCKVVVPTFYKWAECNSHLWLPATSITGAPLVWIKTGLLGREEIMKY